MAKFRYVWIVAGTELLGTILWKSKLPKDYSTKSTRPHFHYFWWCFSNLHILVKYDYLKKQLF
ncbi:MAG: hypothetical protein NTV24_04160 [Candidatus Woesebacteria bacterium]|nr:hypothetical protein [Candidatus Woesebacteria bacterium]